MTRNDDVMSLIQKFDPAFLRYELQLKENTLIILVDLDAYSGQYDLLRHRIDFEFQSIEMAKLGIKMASKYAILCFVALIEYSPDRTEAVYYCREEPSQSLYDDMEKFAQECYFVRNENGQFFKELLIPEEFLQLSISLRALCDCIESNLMGKVIFVLDKEANSLDLQTFKSRGIDAVISGNMISVPTQDFRFARLHRLLSCVFVLVDGSGVTIEGIEFDLQK